MDTTPSGPASSFRTRTWTPNGSRRGEGRAWGLLTRRGGGEGPSGWIRNGNLFRPDQTEDTLPGPLFIAKPLSCLESTLPFGVAHPCRQVGSHGSRSDLGE